MANYRGQAEAQYDPSYNARVTAMKNQLAQNTLALEQSKTGINQNFDTQVNQQNLNNKINKNNVSNTMLGRGLSGSSIVTSGLAESDARNTRIVGDINTNRTGALNDIEAQKFMLAQNMNNTLGQMAGDREKELMALANQLEDRDFEKGFKNRQLAMQQAEANANAAYRNAQLAFEREKWESQKGANQMNPDDLLADVRSIHDDPSTDSATKYQYMRNLITRNKNKPNVTNVIREAEYYQNGYALDLGHYGTGSNAVGPYSGSQFGSGLGSIIRGK